MMVLRRLAWGCLLLVTSCDVARKTRSVPLVDKTSPWSTGFQPAQPPDLHVRPRIPYMELNDYYPCSMCHDDLESNPNVRVLVEDHEDHELQHGNRIWCYSCHNPEDTDTLADETGKSISFNASYQVCARCHFGAVRDFEFGAHGKRLASWTGPRRVLACTDCHNPHMPAIKSRSPIAPPGARRGLQRFVPTRSAPVIRLKTALGTEPKSWYHRD